MIAQALSAVLCLMLLLRSEEDYRFRFRDGKLSGAIMLQVLQVGIPTGIQRTLTSFFNVIVLSYINFFGDACLAGWVVYTKVNHIVVVGLQSAGASVTTFVSQNIGAGQLDRAKTGVRYAYWATLGFAVVTSAMVFFFRRPIAGLFGQDEGMLRYAEEFLS